MINNELNQTRNTKPVFRRFRKQSTYLQHTEADARRRSLRVTFTVPRRGYCVTRRAMLAALRQAELIEWMASGGDYLMHTYQPVR